MANKGPQKKTMLKYLFFIYAYRKKYGKICGKELQITSDKSLFKLFNIDYNSSTEYINRMEEFKILKCVDATYKPGEKCCKYDIDDYYFKKALRQFINQYDSISDSLSSIYLLRDVCGAIENIKYTSLWLYEGETQSVYGEINDIITDYIMDDMRGKSIPKSTDIGTIMQNGDYYYKVLYTDAVDFSEKVQRLKGILESIRRKSPECFEKEFSVTCEFAKDLTDEDLNIIRDAYLARLIETPLMKCIYEDIENLRKMNYDVFFSVNVKFRKTKTRLFISNSGRQYNDLCNISSERRNDMLCSENFDLSFDLHSAIFSVARLLEKGLWDCDWNIKKIILNKQNRATSEKDIIVKSDGDFIENEELKYMMFRVFFGCTLKSGFSQYAWTLRNFNKDFDMADYTGSKVWHSKRTALPAYKPQKTAPKLDLHNYEKIYNICIDECGNLKKYRYTVFYYESLLECRVIAEMLCRGYGIKNVYDCFYFKSTDTTVNEVKNIITEKAKELYEQYVLMQNYKNIDLFGINKSKRKK